MAGTASVTIKGKQWVVDVANTPSELSSGLGGLASIPAGTGTLFDLGGDQVVSVTTVPMLFNLDIVFISSGLQVVDVAQNEIPGQILTENTPVRYFLEVNAGEGTGVVIGDTVEVQGYTPVTSAQSDLTGLVTAFLPFILMLFFMMMMRMITTRLFPPKGRAAIPSGYAPVREARPPRPTPTPSAPVKTEEQERQERKQTLENNGREMARQTGVEFVRVEAWESKSMLPVYWFRDAKGNNIRALDLEELKGKLEILAKRG